MKEIYAYQRITFDIVSIVLVSCLLRQLPTNRQDMMSSDWNCHSNNLILLYVHINKAQHKSFGFVRFPLSIYFGNRILPPCRKLKKKTLCSGNAIFSLSVITISQHIARKPPIYIYGRSHVSDWFCMQYQFITCTGHKPNNTIARFAFLPTIFRRG